MTPRDSATVAKLADRLVGAGYYPPALVSAYLERSTTDEAVTSYVAEKAGRLVAFRFAFPAGRWQEGRGRGLTPKAWPGGAGAAAYFQSCFVDHACMGQGIGRRLAHRAIEDLRRTGARSIVAHSWAESPHDSSRRYLSKLGFRKIAEHPEYWKDINYTCSRCGRVCLCTAAEMVLDLVPTMCPRPAPPY